MDNDKIVELMLKYEKLQAKYRKKFYPNIEDKVINGYHVSDHIFFPYSWFNVYDFEYLTSLLEESITTNKKIEELDRFPELNAMARGEKKL